MIARRTLSPLAVPIRASLAAAGIFCLSTALSQAQIPDAAAQAGNPFEPFVIRLHQNTEINPLPEWMHSEARINAELGSAEIPLPSLAEEPVAERFVATIVFEDGGDGGPAVEWRNRNGESQIVSEGLGEALDDRPLGLNAQTILLPGELTREGGTLIVSYFDRFSALASVTVQPATQSLVAVTGGKMSPVLVDARLKASTSEDADGRRSPPLTGDVRNGSLVEAELAAEIEKLEDEIEFAIPVEGRLEGVMLVADVLGLDPAATVEVILNDNPAGALAMERFALDGPATAQDTAGRLVVAGWRPGSLFLPARMWKAGENRLLLKLKRSAEETGKPVFLRNTGLHLRFSAELAKAPQVDSPGADESEGAAAAPEIDFLQTSPFIALPREPGMPVVITTKP